MMVSRPTLMQIVLSSVFSAVIVMAATLAFLSKGLPESKANPLKHPSLAFSFAFGGGKVSEGLFVIDEFANGYALLTSGPLSINASSFRVLRFTWRPAGPVEEAAFFWRRRDDAGNVIRTDITRPGFNLTDLAMESDWRGEVIEIGFLIAGAPGETIEIRDITLESDSITTRLDLMWHAWTGFEEWSQRSINFLNGGAPNQLVSLPVLVIAWLLISITLMWLASVIGKQKHKNEIAAAAGLLFLGAWILLDMRWTNNNLKQIQHSLQNRWQAEEHQRLSMGLGGDIYQYVEKLKAEILGDQNARILIVGDENADKYFMLKAKYHLLPHSVDFVRGFSSRVKPEFLDFVFYLGESRNITKVPGWNRQWQQALTEVHTGDWGVVYRVGK